jgi:hypothetical protein
MKNIICIIACFLLPLYSLCQSKIAGKVVSEKGIPLVGASVFIPSSAIGVVTDKEGAFVLENIPKTNFKLAVSFVGYEVYVQTIKIAALKEDYTISLKPKSAELADVVIRNYERDGWKRWGKFFSDEFIGESAFTQYCTITNKDVIKFVFSETKKELYAYASEPLIIDNAALGYRILVELVDFMCHTDRHEVDYKMYTFFTPMHGTEEEEVVWKQNREMAYSLSLMHFMRSLYEENLKQEGYDIRVMQRKENTEKVRVNDLFKSAEAAIIDSVGKKNIKEKEVAKLAEKNFVKDSLKYYRKVLNQQDRSEEILPAKVTFRQIARHTDSGTVILDFPDYLYIAYKRQKEPLEYFDFRNQVVTTSNMLRATSAQAAVQDWPKTVFNLTEGIPIEVSESGYFNNTNLMLDGFWGWWEKLATKLPYEYNP